MNDTATPRTDAELLEVNEMEADSPRVEPCDGGTLVNACFARTLELELAAATNKADNYESRAEAWTTIVHCCIDLGHKPGRRGETGLMGVCRFIRESHEQLAAATAALGQHQPELCDQIRAERDALLTEQTEAFCALDRCIATGEMSPEIDPRLFAGIERLKAARDAEAAKARIAVAGMTAAREDCDVLRRALDAACEHIDSFKYSGCTVSGPCVHPENGFSCIDCWREHFTAQAAKQEAK
jgi:hypothetical protein